MREGGSDCVRERGSECVRGSECLIERVREGVRKGQFYYTATTHTEVQYILKTYYHAPYSFILTTCSFFYMCIFLRYGSQLDIKAARELANDNK